MKGKAKEVYKGDVEITSENTSEWKKKLKDVKEITGNLYINVQAELPQLQTVGGNLSIYAQAELQAPQLQTVGGDLYINVQAELSQLQTVGGYLYINAQAELPQLQTVGGYLYINAQAELQAPQLQTVGGYLYIYAQAELPQLQTVGGDLYIYAQAELPQLQTVGGDLYINVQAELPQLQTVGGNLSIYAQAELPQLQTVGGNLSIYAQAELPQLQTVGGYLYINAQLDEDFEKQLWQYNSTKQWFVSDACSEWLLSRNGKLKYYLDKIEFDRSLFDAIRKESLTAFEVFQIRNVEQRRVAYERMDKSKISELPGLKILDETTDQYSNPMRVLTFKADDISQPFRYLHCICPSTGREYYLETDQKSCDLAKAKSFGLSSKVEFVQEW